MSTITPIRRRHARRCPICKTPARRSYHPFCSARCAEVDLGRWLAGDYRIPQSDDDEDSDNVIRHGRRRASADERE